MGLLPRLPVRVESLHDRRTPICECDPLTLSRRSSPTNPPSVTRTSVKKSLYKTLDITARQAHHHAMPAYESRVREFRVKAGFTQEQLARQLGVSRQTVVNIEHGLNEPKVLLAIALGALLGAALGELFRTGGSVSK